MVMLAAALLIEAGALEGGQLAHDEVDEFALQIVEACGEGPLSPPTGTKCLAAAVAIWATETRGNFTVFPKTGTGCGVMQVAQPSRCFKNTRLGRQCAQPCTALRMTRLGLEWGVRVLRWKRQRARSMAHAFRKYNASGAVVKCSYRAGRRLKGKSRPRYVCYGAAASRLYQRLLRGRN